MPRDINGQRYYTASEVCREVDISRPTLFRWLKRGVLTRLHRDRRGWRMFTEDDLRNIRLEAGRIDVEESS
jgi:DNA-binding transcriptional MerR regulator